MKNLLTFSFKNFFSGGFLLLLLSVPSAFADDILIITNKASNLDSFSQSEVRQVYMGGTLSRKYEAVTLPVENPVRQKFNVNIIGLTENRIQSYWAQLLFTGRSVRPTELDTVKEIVDYISEKEDRVAYVPADTDLPDNVIVVFKR